MNISLPIQLDDYIDTVHNGNKTLRHPLTFGYNPPLPIFQNDLAKE